MLFSLLPYENFISRREIYILRRETYILRREMYILRREMKNSSLAESFYLVY